MSKNIINKKIYVKTLDQEMVVTFKVTKLPLNQLKYYVKKPLITLDDNNFYKNLAESANYDLDPIDFLHVGDNVFFNICEDNEDSINKTVALGRDVITQNLEDLADTLTQNEIGNILNDNKIYTYNPQDVYDIRKNLTGE